MQLLIAVLMLLLFGIAIEEVIGQPVDKLFKNEINKFFKLIKK